MLKTVNVSEYFKVQIDTKFPFSFKLFFFITSQKIDIYLHVSEYHNIHSTSLCPLMPVFAGKCL